MLDTVIFNIQKYSLHDGDGIRTTVFFKGCPLACKWCHNPEGISPNPEIAFYPERCRNCGRCAKVCPDGKAPAHITEAGCQACGECVAVCVYGAREIIGKPYTVEDIISIVAKDDAFYQTSGGGVTLSGGEVMAQNRDFLLSLLRGLKRRGYHVAIDTCGYAPFPLFEDVMSYTDMFLYDIKFINSEKHRRFTGRDNDLILANLKKLSDAGASIHARIPVVEGANADTEEIEAIAEFLTKHVHTERVTLLPYHALGRDKLRRIGKTAEEYSCFSTPDEGHMDVLAEIFIRRGFIVERV